MKVGCDVIAIGNAIVDIICKCDDNFLAGIGLHKGQMRLVDNETQITGISRHLRAGLEVAGGSAANTAVGIASLGGRVEFVGKVADDDMGRIFGHDIRGMGVKFTTPPKQAAGKETSRSLVLVTPDHRRSMVTYLGCSAEIDESLIEIQTIKDAKILLLEGYLFDKPQAKSIMRRAAMLARVAGKSVALTLSDPQCVARHRLEFFELIRAGVDVLFANEKELKSLFATASFDDAVRLAGQSVSTSVLTRSERGSVVVSKGVTMQIPAEAVHGIVDMTGAGDLYAAGFLYGLSHKMDLMKSARLGSFLASEIICQFGARPEAQLESLARMRGFIQ
jgi:sugar/nucleoside kinase (ribokinase family)